LGWQNFNGASALKNKYITDTTKSNSEMKQSSLLRINQFHWAAFLLSAIIVIRPIIIFLNSGDEFSLSFGVVLEFALILFLKLFLSTALIGLLFNLKKLSKLGRIFTAFSIGLAILLWIQGNFFLWNYGQLDGKPLNYDAYNVHGIGELTLWISIMFYVLFKYEIVSQWAKKTTLIILASLFLSVLLAYIDKPKDVWHKTYQVVSDNYFKFSNEKNIIIFVIDAARGDIFEDMLSEMTEQEKAIFNGFTFFRNTTGTFNSTNPAVSGILTGKLYDYKENSNKVFSDFFHSHTSLPFQLKKLGFVTEIYPYNNNSVFLAPDIVDNLKKIENFNSEELKIRNKKDFDKINLICRFNFSPHYLKKLLFNSSNMYGVAASQVNVSPPIDADDHKRTPSELPLRLKEHLRYNRYFIDSFGSKLSYRQEPVFKYFHYHGAHFPFIHDENYVGKILPVSIESYKRQYKGSLLLSIKALTDSLKKQGVYEETMLLVMGDHGLFVPESDGVYPQLNNMDRRVVESLIPLLMIKPFGESSMPIKLSSAPVSLFDIPTTIFDSISHNTYDVGRSVFSFQENEPRTRFVYSRPFSLKRKDSDNKVGAIEYEINGDVKNLSSWKPTYRFLIIGIGKIEVSHIDYQSRAKELSEYFDNTARFNVNK
jgi:hypothetical protein